MEEVLRWEKSLFDKLYFTGKVRDHFVIGGRKDFVKKTEKF